MNVISRLHQSTPRLLMLIPQFPFDPASGAAISNRTICEILAGAGWRVRVVATTATESKRPVDVERTLESVSESGVETLTLTTGQRAYGFSRRAVDYELLDTGAARIDEARRTFVGGIDTLLQAELQDRRPDVLLTYGSSEAEVQRRRAARQAGVRVVFSLRNTAYRHERSFAAVDAILTPSRFVSDYYRRLHGVESTPLPTPVQVQDVLSPIREPVFCTLINPTIQKGLLFFLNVVKQCRDRLPQLRFLTVESRESGEFVAQMAMAIGLNTDCLHNLHVARGTPDPAGIYGVSKCVLVPSYQEASSRVVVEAQLNGIPVIGSDRGGLPETVATGGFILPISDETASDRSSEAVGRWVQLLGRLHMDAAFYRTATEAALKASHPFRCGEVDRLYISFFEALLPPAGGEPLHEADEGDFRPQSMLLPG